MTFIVTLNIGGCLFQTSKETLEKEDTFFRPLLANYSEETIAFVDRDPTFFRYVLNWMRGSRVLPDDRSILLELYEEANFYCIEDMKKQIASIMKITSSYMECMNNIKDSLKFVGS